MGIAVASDLANSSTVSSTSTPRIHSISFNGDCTAFAVALDTGFRVYGVDPVRELMRHEFEEGGLGLVALLGKSNLIAMVGGGAKPRFPSNRVMLWDSKQSKFIAELEFRSPVLGLNMSSNRLIVVLKSRLFVYGMAEGTSLERLMVFDTYDNDRGIADVSQDGSLLVFPGKQKGHIQIVDISGLNIRQPSSIIIAAHNHALSAMALCPKGKLVATASERGTLIRLYDIDSGQLQTELRRGADQAEIHNLRFSPDGQRLAVSSDKGTIHIFSASAEEDKSSNVASSSLLPNKESSLKMLKDFLPKYFSSKWSPAHARINEVRSAVAFQPNALQESNGTEENASTSHTLTNPHAFIVISWDGTLYKFVYDPQRGGPCVADIVTKFLNLTPSISSKQQ